ncbi:MAG: hypothetical protein H6753_01045 [Candidatus Omnitrophica bacterium]|nr:hypothetical protein [Candidatus Omnitrophota bacterium]
MGAINVKKMGLACGLTLVVFRLGCIIVFMALSREQAIAFFNTLLHGIDVTAILKTETSVLEVIYGLVQIFILGWLGGATLASIYNLPILLNTKGDNKHGSCCH